MDDISLALNPPHFVKQRKRSIRLSRSPSRVWPLPSINGREPVVLESSLDGQNGIELAYPRFEATDAAANCPIGTPNGTKNHIMPSMTPALSIDDGVIAFAGRMNNTYVMLIDHGNGWASQYAGLEAICAIRTDLYRPRVQHLRAGDVIGYVGSPERDGFKRLYFELWRADALKVFAPVEPLDYVTGWKLVEHHDHFTPAPPVTKEAA